MAEKSSSRNKIIIAVVTALSLTFIAAVAFIAWCVYNLGQSAATHSSLEDYESNYVNGLTVGVSTALFQGQRHMAAVAQAETKTVRAIGFLKTNYPAAHKDLEEAVDAVRNSFGKGAPAVKFFQQFQIIAEDRAEHHQAAEQVAQDLLDEALEEKQGADDLVFARLCLAKAKRSNKKPAEAAKLLLVSQESAKVLDEKNAEKTPARQYAVEQELAYCLAEQNENDKALAKLQKLLAWNKQFNGGKSSQAQLLNWLGYCQLKMGKPQEAVASYNEAITLDPKFQNLYYWRANCYEQLKQSAQALADYSKALELNAKDAGCLEERGNLYLKTGDYKNAALDLNAAVKLAPRDPDKYRSRAVLHRLEKHYDLVVQDFDQSIRLNKSQPNPFDYIQRAQAKARLSQESAALADCDQAIKLMPLLDTSYLAKADILMKFKKTDQALKVINQCLTSELYRTPPAQGWSEAAGGPDYAFVLRKRAAILDSLGRSKEAAKDRQEATKVSKSAEIQPFNAKYLFTD